MRTAVFRWTRLWILAALALLLLGIAALITVPAAALATESGNSDRGPWPGVAACSEGIPERPGTTQFVDGLVADEVITPEQADEIRARLSDRRELACLARGLWERGNAINAIADATDTSRREVLGALVAGDSAAAYAAEHGVDEATLIDAIMAGPRARADELIAAGELDRQAADEVLAALETRAAELIHVTDMKPRGKRIAGGMFSILVR